MPVDVERNQFHCVGRILITLTFSRVREEVCKASLHRVDLTVVLCEYEGHSLCFFVA